MLARQLQQRLLPTILLHLLLAAGVQEVRAFNKATALNSLKSDRLQIREVKLTVWRHTRRSPATPLATATARLIAPVARDRDDCVGQLIMINQLGLCRADDTPLVPGPWIGLVRLKQGEAAFSPRQCRRLESQLARARRRGACGLIYDLRQAGVEFKAQFDTVAIQKNLTVASVEPAAAATATTTASGDTQEAAWDRLLRIAAESVATAELTARLSSANPSDKNSQRQDGRQGNHPKVGSGGSHRNWQSAVTANATLPLLFLICLCLIAVLLLIRLYPTVKWPTGHGEAPAAGQGNEASLATLLGRIETRRYNKGGQQQQHLQDLCVVCLDAFRTGQCLRVLPCRHEYHKGCLEPWLLTGSKTCPICIRSVVVAG